MKNALVTLALIVSLVIIPLGCATQQSAATKKAVAKLQTQGAVQLQTAKNTGAVKLQVATDSNAVNKANGTEAPATHPIAATNNTVAELHAPLLILTLVFVTLYAIAFGLSFTGFQLLTPLIPAFRMAGILFAVALFTLPFMPIAIFAVIGAALGLFIYEMIRAKGNVKLAIEDEEADLGFGSKSTVTTTATTTVTKIANNSSGLIAIKPK